MRQILAISAVALLLLAGCSTTVENPPAADPIPAPTPTMTATPEAPELSELVLSVNGFRSLDTAGEEQESFVWTTEDAQPAIDYLTEVTGLTPTTVPYDGGFHDVNGTTYSWAGFSLTYSHGTEGQEPRGFHVRFTSDSAGPLTLRSESGVRVGSTIAQLEALGGTLISESGANLIYGVDQVTLPAVPDQGDPEVLSVGAFTSGSGAVEWLGAPYSSTAP